MSDRSQGETALVQFSERLTNSAAFGTLFREGMDLVEETAAYLDGAGRNEAKALDRSVSLTYATESMRLTTRLMHIAAWLLYQRAVNEGEISLADAAAEKSKFQFNTQELCSTGALFSQLPHELQDICLHSLRIQHRVQHLDLLLCSDSATKPGHERPVDNLHQHLRAAFQIGE